MPLTSTATTTITLRSNIPDSDTDFSLAFLCLAVETELCFISNILLVFFFFIKFPKLNVDCTTRIFN